MPDKCDDCGRSYFIIYRVPNNIWTKIAPKPETLGSYTEYQFGGILCPDCAARRARDVGVTLYFEAKEEWDQNEINKLRDLVEKYRYNCDCSQSRSIPNECANCEEALNQAKGA